MLTSLLLWHIREREKFNFKNSSYNQVWAVESIRNIVICSPEYPHDCALKHQVSRKIALNLGLPKVNWLVSVGFGCIISPKSNFEVFRG